MRPGIALLSLWSVLALVPLDGLADGQDPVAPPIDIRIEARPLQATVGDPIRIDLDIKIPPGVQIRFPSLPEQLGDFTVLSTIPGPDVPADPAEKRSSPTSLETRGQEGAARHHRARITVAVYRTGEFEFPPLPIAVTDTAGKQQEVSTPTIKIRIESVLTEAEPSLKDLKKQAEIEAPNRCWLWLISIGVAAALLGMAWYRMRRQKKPAMPHAVQPDEDPLDIAEKELKELQGLGLLEKGMIKQYYVRLSEIVKRALEAGYGIQTVEKTTSEIIEALASEPETGGQTPMPAVVELVETLLLSCDMVKFARYVPSRAESEEAENRAFRVLSECRLRRMPAAAAAVTVAGDP
jgi:hypothetical protein